MRIAIAATHGAGKTKFAQGLAKAIGGNYIHDIVREEAIPKGFKFNKNTPPEVQLWLTMRQWELEMLTPEPWVADKCLLDYLVYGDILIKDQEIMKMVKRIVESSARYNLVFYFPIEFEMEEDGFRSKELQPVIDAAYKEYLEKRGIKYITLPSFIKESSSKEEAIKKRINLALNYIK